MELKYFPLSEHSVEPTRGTRGSAGYDLSSAAHYTIEPWTRLFCDTDLIIIVPEGYYGRVASRSGLASKCIDVGAGVIDSDYRGNVRILLCNNGPEPFAVKPGDRIAQLILEKITTPQVRRVDMPDVTDRGDKGFGSTG